MGESEGAARPGPIRVFLLDDHEIVRQGLRRLLAAEPDIEVVGEAGTVAAARAQLPVLSPDVAVLDVRLPDGDGIAVCREIRSTVPGISCLMVTSHGEDQALFGAILAGADGYVLKGACGQELVTAVRTVARGRPALDAHAAQRMMDRLRERMAAVDPLTALAGQERKVLELIGEGLTNRQIGTRLHLAEKTVKNNVTTLLRKLGFTRRTEAAAYAARTGRG
jgi:DNA-binding NarL/FixJ family response regulator